MRQDYAKIGIIVVTVFVIVVLSYLYGRTNLNSSNEYDHIESVVQPKFIQPDTSLPLASKSSAIPVQEEISRYVKKKRQLTDAELEAVSVCRRRNLRKEHKNSWDNFFKNDALNIRYNKHTYLNNGSTVIEVGGNVGRFSDALQRLFKPRRYIILEPIKNFYDVLAKKYRRMSNIVVLNFGLSAEDRIDRVKVSGVSTSRFLSKKKTKDVLAPLRQFSSTNFFLSMAVGIFEVDLLTMNCEGCEYDILDAILDSNLINYFRHVQISFHHLKGLGDTLDRWCQYQQLLSRTHRLMYQYPFFWESWTRKDLKL